MREIKQIGKVVQIGGGGGGDNGGGGGIGGYLSTGIWWSMCHSNTLYSEAQLKGNGGL